MRPLWTGSLSFGLINVPVKLYSGSESRGGIELNMLHKDDLSPIRYAKICREDAKELQMSDIVKGYEYQPGDYVILTEEDFEKANASRSKTIDIVEFTDEKEIDPRLFEKPYLLEADKGAEKAYALLREALNKSGKVAVAKFVLRNREHLGAIKSVGKLLVLDQMRWPSDLRSAAGLKIPDEKAEKKEIDMALKLIDHLTSHFIPEDFKDTYTDELEKAIQAKAKGKKPKVQKAAEKHSTTDLMAALKSSLETAKK